jgi:hypothetical protein
MGKILLPAKLNDVLHLSLALIIIADQVLDKVMPQKSRELKQRPAGSIR